MAFLAPVIGSVVAGGLNYLGARKANELNREMAREQMDFQRDMSNTAYQRTIRDMEAAGVNPAMALFRGGASTPQGASARAENEAVGVASSAREVGRIKAEMENLKANTEKVRTEAMVNRAIAELNDLRIPGAINDAILERTDVGKFRALMDKILPSVNSAVSATRLIK